MEQHTMETRYRGSSRQLLETDGNAGFDLPGHSRSRRTPKYTAEPPRLSSLLLVVVFIVGIFGFIRYIEYRLPTPLTAADVQNNPSSFIEERARNDLITLTSVGPRPCGSHSNDIVAVDTVLRMLNEIKSMKFAVHTLEFEKQLVSGAFFLTFQDGHTSSYSHVPNVIARLEPTRNKVNSSILVNCHIDSIPGGPGASDDMVSCAVMLEILRVLTRQSKPLRNNIVFLFNGAEENVLQASHGFVKGKVDGTSEVGHKWAKNIKTFINLEAAGCGGREILFQTGPGNGWLLESYKTVPYPWGSVVGEEFFQKGLIPSETDYRIFRDYLKIPGLDFAFIKNGWFYHTKFDAVEAITDGSIQHEGANILALVEHLGNLDFNEVEYTDTKMVFFDVFGFFMVVYSENTGIVLNIAIAIVTLVIAWREAHGNVFVIGKHILSTCGAWVAGMVAAISVALFLNLTGCYSPFHSYPMMVLILFGVPCITAQVFVYAVTLKGSEDTAWMAGKTTVAILLLFTTFLTRIVFSLAINLLFGLIGWYAARKIFEGYQKRLAFYLIVGEAFPLALSLYLIGGSIDAFVPIMGRAGSQANPNLFLAVLTALTLTVPTFCGIVPIFLFFKKAFVRGTALLLLLSFVGILLFLRNPYGDKTPMRLHILEVDRTYFDHDLTTIKKNDAGYWFFNVDPNIPAFYDQITENSPQLQVKIAVDAYECEDLYCGLPFYFPVKTLVRNTQWIPKKEGLSEEMKARVRMDITEDTFIAQDTRRISFSFVGPDHMTIQFSPGKNYDLSKWSLTEEIPPPPPADELWKGRPTYFVYHSRGYNFERFNVTMDFQRKKESIAGSKDPVVDINFSSFYLFGDEMQSSDLKDVIRRLPSWTYVIGWSGITQIYSIPV